MSNNVMRVFESKQFGQLRTILKNDDVWFVGKDVAKALGYANTKDALIYHVHKEDKCTLQRSQISTFENHIPKSILPVNFVAADIPNRGLTIINESGLYALIFGSKLEAAEEFKHWVTHDVLPSIRKTGGYIMGQEEMSDIELLSRAILVAQNQIAQRDSRIAEMEPVVDFAQRCLLAEGAVTTTSIAKNYGLSANKLNQLLKGLGVQYKVGNQWVLYSQYQDCGYTETRRTPIQKKNGEMVLVSETLWTPKGIEFIDRMLQSVNVEKVSA